MSFLRTWNHTFEIYASRKRATPLPISMREKEPTFSMQAVLLQVVKLSRIVKIRERLLILFSSVQSFSHVQFFAIPWTAEHQASLYITKSPSLLKLMSIELVMPSQPPHPLLPPSPPAFNLSWHQNLFQSVSSSHEVARVFGVSASTSVLPMNTQD